MLKPTVGIISSLNFPVANTLTRVVFPAFCRPTKVISISVFQNNPFSHSKKFRNALAIAAMFGIFRRANSPCQRLPTRTLSFPDKYPTRSKLPKLLHNRKQGMPL
mmetsp:Transcript_2146/g.4403  ORF Transcript_2146/g.4403 Transcript_2146/m.4403 type:complete len:105 (-) Transcript_2146:205-519(-)